MLDVSAGRLTAVAGALLLRAVVVIDSQPPSPDVRWGDIVDHTLEVTREGYRFKLRDYSGPEVRIVDVRYRGTLPDSVCEGQDASIEGNFEGELFIATEVHGPLCYKGNPCRPYACLPDLERPIECRRSFKFE